MRHATAIVRMDMGDAEIVQELIENRLEKFPPARIEQNLHTVKFDHHYSEPSQHPARRVDQDAQFLSMSICNM